MHFYIPGWEVPKFSPTHFTDEYGFIADYIAEFFRVMRKYNYSDTFDKFKPKRYNCGKKNSVRLG